MLTKKGIIFTLDAIFALLAATTIIIAAFFYMSQVSKIPFNKQSLNHITQDSLTILEKDGTLKATIETNSTSTISTFLNSLPSQICAKIDLLSTDQTLLLNTTKTNCNVSQQIVITRRSFIHNFTTYYAKMESWYK